MAYTISELKELYKDKEYKDLNQCERILKRIVEKGSISPKDAMNKLGIYRLASRVNDLKRRGYIIVGEMTSGKNKFGEKTNFKVYRLIEKEGI